MGPGEDSVRAEFPCATPLFQFQVMREDGVTGAQRLGWEIWECGASPIVGIRQLESGPGQLDMLLANNKGQDLLIR